MNIVKTYLVLSLFMLLQLGLVGQSTRTDSIYVDDRDATLMEFSGNMYKPVLAFDRAVDKYLYGASFSIFRQRDSERYSFYGFDLSFARLGSLVGTINSGLEQFEDRTTTNYWSTQFVYRHYTPFYLDNIEPFVEASLGPHVIYTSTSTTFFDEQGSTEFTFEQTGFGVTYAVGAGTCVKMTDRVLLLIKGVYSGGTATSFLLPDEDSFLEFPIDNFYRTTSAVNHLSLRLGITMTF